MGQGEIIMASGDIRVLETSQIYLDAMFKIVRRYKFHGTNALGELVYSNKSDVVEIVWDRDKDCPSQVTVKPKWTNNKRVYKRKPPSEAEVTRSKRSKTYVSE